MYSHDLEVMGSKPGQVELWCVVLLSYVVLEPKINVDKNIHLFNP